MTAWLDENTLLVAVLAAAAGLLALLLLVFWLLARRRAARERRARIEAQGARLELELLLQEQQGRLRIVRELHEVAVHSVSVIISQADGAQYAAATDPGAAVRSAAVIADAGRATLADLRRVMTIVREGEADAAPQPRLKTVRDLFEVMANQGLDVTFVETGDRFDLKPGAELAIIRILQESLSNALTHGGVGTEVKVALTWTAEGLQVLVDDDGVRSAARRDGLDPDRVAQQRTYTFEDDLNALTEVVVGPGISEMRERASIFGGILNAYAVPGVGFTVSAVFPSLRYDNGVHGVNLGT